MMSMQEFYTSQSRAMPYHLSSSPTPSSSAPAPPPSLLLAPRQPVLLMAPVPSSQWDLGASNPPPVQLHNDWGIPASHMALTQPASPAAQPLAAAQRPAAPSRKRAKLDHEEPEAITSKYRGVCWYKRTRRWVAQTKINGKRVHLGYFDDEESAAQAYRDKVSTLERGRGGGAAATAAAVAAAAATAAATDADAPCKTD